MGLFLSSFKPALERALTGMSVTCDLHSCNSHLFARNFPGGRTGIRVDERWYCSVDCFVRALRAPLFVLLSPRAVEVPRSPRLSLGLVMLSKGYVSADQLRAATRQSQLCGESLDVTLVRLGMATEKQLAAARSAQWGYPVLAPEHIGHRVQADIPRGVLDACSAVLLHRSESARRMVIGFVSRVEHALLESVERVTGYRVEPCFITATDFAEQSDRLTCLPGYNEILVEEPGAPERMARTVGRSAVDIHASEARFTLCRNMIWVRLTGKRGTSDVVFRGRNAARDGAEANSECFTQAFAFGD